MIIGIAGHARHGKDSTADIICKHFHYKKKSLADPMKEALKAVFPKWGYFHFYGDEKDIVDPEYGISPRHALQCFGTQWAQFELAKYDDFAKVTGRKLWVKALLDNAGKNTVIADVRFPHEAEAIRKQGGFIIMVKREYPIDLSHESERSVDEINPDFTINNYGTLIDLEYQVCELMEALNEQSRV